jgi:inosose dehydratase
MSSSFSRRDFIAALGAVAASSALPVEVFGGGPREYGAALYPPTELTYFANPVTPVPGSISFGYAAITWGGNDKEAIKEIAEIGFKGIQLRTSVLPEFEKRPAALRELLVANHLKFTAFSSGGIGIAPGTEAEEIAKHVRNATFVRDAGGLYLQVTDSARQKDRKPTADDFKQLGRVMTEIARRVVDLGVPLGYHNHMNSLGEAPDEVDRIMDATDPRYVKLELDIAHYRQGGGDPVKAIRKYRDRLLFLHIKDVESPVPGATGDTSRSYRFVELGRGKVDLPAVFAALKQIKFRGWAVVELDSVPDNARTPKESAIICKKYLEEELGMRVSGE